MRTATEFVFDAYEVDVSQQLISFRYTILFDNGSHEELCETLKLSVPIAASKELEGILQALHLALGISYYKTFLPSTFKVPYTLGLPAADFWNAVYQHGLGEFLFVNKIPQERLAVFSAAIDDIPSPIHVGTKAAAVLGIGGGKDSIVAAETLRQLGVPLTGFVLGTANHYGQAAPVAEKMDITMYPVERRLDPKLLELSKEAGALNGHIPISIIFGFVGVLLAILTKQQYVVVANEASASIPHAVWEGKDVNHQWSKSFESETAFQAFIHRYISQDITYFSAIRPLSSVAVAKLFARYPQYFEVFTSDNFVFRIDPTKRGERWSNESPKSLSSFILLGPWLEEATMLQIFSKDFLNESTLDTLLLELAGVEGHRPLDCVGTAEEIVLSLNLLEQQGKFNKSTLMQLARARNIIHSGDWETELQKALQPQAEQAFPPDLVTKLNAYYEQALEQKA